MKNIRPVREAVSHSPRNANVAVEERSEEYPELGTIEKAPSKASHFFKLKNFMSYTSEVKTKCKSTLSYPECARILSDWSVKFDTLSIDDLDALYRVAFGHWAYHMSRLGYEQSLQEYRAKLFISNYTAQLLKES